MWVVDVWELMLVPCSSSYPQTLRCRVLNGMRIHMCTPPKTFTSPHEDTRTAPVFAFAPHTPLIPLVLFVSRLLLAPSPVSRKPVSLPALVSSRARYESRCHTNAFLGKRRCDDHHQTVC
ncbi:hypothetical protein SJAG_05246 [Schizosaccharomyces japonicus yFS275]|uniref:Uncharacterized protein n=1 Tax=Schizosaccharomyces japonicus (strain yFS275 / FY16936) TaxID=402676 RepID=B6JYX3_SCHJY|nr:hypothetical protein SJAG_05246 [Schizosaccharomyces japonicus yFS275]EEB06741.1 hypothetical protein SJAG_05246 [Schizosaccharomyces japonicus yFS275]